LVPDQQAEFLAYLESLYSDTAALVDQWNGVVTEDLIDAVLVATVNCNRSRLISRNTRPRSRESGSVCPT
jgi:hypothetical protein